MTVVLTNNYRSTQPILDISKTLINRNEERLVKQIDGLSKELLASNLRINGLTDKPSLHEYNSVKEEMADITNRVYDLLQQKQSLEGSLLFTRRTNTARAGKIFSLKEHSGIQQTEH